MVGSRSRRTSSGGENDHTCSRCQLNNHHDRKGKQTSIIVLFNRLAIITHFSSSNATLQTASAGDESSRTSWPLLRSHTLTLPSLPPLTTRVSSNCNDVTLLSWAANRWIGAIFSNDHTRTEPSEPPVTSVFPRICS